MNHYQTHIIAPFIINGVVLWDYTFRDGICIANQYEAFMTMSDEMAWYVPVLFEKL